MATKAVASFDFIFEAPEKTDAATLLQGDLLQRTPALARTISEAHGYYAESRDYSHFLVLTQTCDLVRRKGGHCKSRYVTICAVRPLSLAVQRELAKYAESVPRFPLPVGDLEKSVLARQFLERVMNNTVDGIFFVPRGSAPSVDEHLCAFLPLSIAMRATHYDALLEAKVAQADPIFAAKIGSLTSNLYSRIATPDFGEQHGLAAAKVFQDQFFEELGLKSVAWLSPYQRRALDDAVSKYSEGAEIDAKVAQQLLQQLPSEVNGLAERAVEVLVKRGIVEDAPDVRRRATNFLVNDPQFSRIARGR